MHTFVCALKHRLDKHKVTFKQQSNPIIKTHTFLVKADGMHISMSGKLSLDLLYVEVMYSYQSEDFSVLGIRCPQER